MMEWGVVQTNDRKAVMVIEEGAGGGIFKQALRHIWVQMTGLPEELRDFPTIWGDWHYSRGHKGCGYEIHKNF
jgi:hypothetical protein